MDHSAFDAYAFLVECDGQRVLYSGDFREGGWKHETVERLASVSNGVDVLLLEGTTVGRTAGSAPSTEPVVSGRLVDLFKEFKGKPILVWASAQNIDRVVSMVKACNRAGKMPVVDIYAGMILERLARTNNRLPHPRLGRPDGMRVFYAERTWKNFRRRNPRYDVPEVLKKPVRIFPEELNRRLGTAVLLVRDSMQDDLQRMENCHDGLLVYSMWSGYKKEENAARFLNWLKGRGFSVEDVHASGHANRESMQKLVNLVAPRLILPIHTERPKEYRSLFPKHKILCLNDGEPYTIPLMGGGLAPTA
jgi:ribonuclease J